MCQLKVLVRQPLQDIIYTEEKEEKEEHVEEFSLADATSKGRSGISLYFNAKPLDD